MDKNGPNKVGRQEIHYASRGGGGADGVEDTSPSVNPEGGGYSVGDGNGGMRVAGGGDFGLIGPLTQADVRAGKLPLARTGPAPGKNALKPITAAQRRAFDNALAVRAGAATPAN